MTSLAFRRVVLGCILAGATPAGRVSAADAPAAEHSAVVRLDPARTETIYLRPLEVTTIAFRTKLKIDRVVKGSNIVQVATHEDNTFNLFPTVTEGRTNMQVTIGGRVYTFILVIAQDETPNGLHAYSTSDADGDDGDYSAATAARPLKPQDIDTVGYIKTIEKARFDRTYRDTLSNYLNIPVGRSSLWNESPVTLVEVNWFGDVDLLVIKVEWMNNSGSVLNLNSKQVGLRITNKAIPVTASQQVASQLFPGQLDTLWLFVQGYHLAPRNDWSLTLPPDAEAVQRLLKTK